LPILSNIASTTENHTLSRSAAADSALSPRFEKPDFHQIHIETAPASPIITRACLNDIDDLSELPAAALQSINL
jgi:hypothetical protein